MTQVGRGRHPRREPRGVAGDVVDRRRRDLRRGVADVRRQAPRAARTDVGAEGRRADRPAVELRDRRHAVAPGLARTGPSRRRRSWRRRGPEAVVRLWNCGLTSSDSLRADVRAAQAGAVGARDVQRDRRAGDLLARRVEQREAVAVASRAAGPRRSGRGSGPPGCPAAARRALRPPACGKSARSARPGRARRRRGRRHRGGVGRVAAARPRGGADGDGGDEERRATHGRQCRHRLARRSRYGAARAVCDGIPPPDGTAHEQEERDMAERAAIVTGASSGIGLAIADMLGARGLRADHRRAPAGEARGRGRGPARQGLRRPAHRGQPRRRGDDRRRREGARGALRPPRRARQQRGRRHRRGRRRPHDQEDRHPARHEPALDLPLLPRGAADAARAPARSTATRSSSTRRRSPASAARAGCRSTPPRSTASSASRRR